MKLCCSLIQRDLILNRFICFILVITIGFVTTSKLFAKDTLIVGLSEYPPYYYTDSSGVWLGSSLDVLRRVAQKADIKLKIVKVPWSRAIKYIKVGEIDLMLNITRTKAREKFMDFIGLCSYEQMALIVKKENANIKFDSLDDLKLYPKKQFGLQLDYYYPQITERLKSDFKFRNYFDLTVNSQTNIKKTLGGRIIGFFDDKFFAIYATKIDPKYKELVVHPFSLNKPQKVNIAASLKTAIDKRERLKKAHSFLTEKGTIEKIIGRLSR